MTAPQTRGRWSLTIAVTLHVLLFLILAMVALPPLEGGDGGNGVGLEDIAGNADYDDAPTLSLPSLPTPPDLPAPPEPQSLAIAPPAPPTAIDKPVVAPESRQMQMQSGGTPDGDMFLTRVRAHLARYRRALPLALREVRGTVLLRFTLAPDGTVRGVVVAASSGNAALDREALALLARAQPLPAKPATITLTVPIEFLNSPAPDR